jgi:diguanylate cyclase (GGDEF)-like protein
VPIELAMSGYSRPAEHSAGPSVAGPCISVADVIDRLRAWVAVIAIDGTVLDIVGGDGMYFGYPTCEVVGRNTLEFLDAPSAEALVETFMQGPDAPVYAKPVAFPITIVSNDGTRSQAEIIPAGFEHNGHKGWVVTITKLDEQAPSVTALHQIVQGNSLHETATAVAQRLTYENTDGFWNAVLVVEPDTTHATVAAGAVGSATERALRDVLGPDQPTAIWNQVEPNGFAVFAEHEVPAPLAEAMQRDGTSQVLVVRVDTSSGLGMVVMQFVLDRKAGGLNGNTVLYVAELRTVLTRALERELGLRALADRATRDPLTGLLNRAGFGQITNPLSDDAAMIFIDLDRFKAINDTFGHASGDRVLEELANRLRWTCRSGDLVARLGGDEFAVLIPHAGPEVAERVAQSILESIALPLPAGLGPTHVTASVGVAHFAEQRSLSEALAAADRAMFAAKREGRGVIMSIPND